jgi:hypothetical protein
MKEVDRAYVMMTDYNAYVAVALRDGSKKGGTKTLGAAPAVPLSRTNQALYRPGIPGAGGNRNVPLDRTTGDVTMRNLTATPSELAQGLKHRIAAEVVRMAPQIENVYVSANPDFVARMTSYMEDVRLGHPIQGYVAEFNAMVERIFPARAGVQNHRTMNSRITR